MAEGPAPSKDYYAILGVPPTADREQIESAYRALARQHHPDAHPQGSGSAAEFKRVTEAYETLSDSRQRRQYDRRHAWTPWPAHASGAAEPMHAAPPSGNPVGHPFDLLNHGLTGTAAPPGFGMFESKPPQAPQTSGIGGHRDLEVELPLSPEEARYGGPCEFTVSLANACRDCRAGSSACGTCGGSGRVMHRFRLRIHLPPGLADGEILRVPGRGKPARTGEAAGDLRLKIRVRPCWI